MAKTIIEPYLPSNTVIFPIGFHWDITQKCNFQCNFCLNNSGKCAPNELSFSQKIELIDRLFDLGVIYIRILGGEPFSLPNTIDIMEYAVSRGMQLAFSTNGSFLNDGIVSTLTRIRKGISYIQISLYGSTPSTMARITNSKSAFPQVQYGMQLLRQHRLPFTVLVVICHENTDDIVPLYEYAKAMGAENFRLVLKADAGRGQGITSFNSIQTMHDWSNVISVLQRIAYLSQKSYLNVQFDARPLLGRYINERFGIEYFYNLCEAGVRYLYCNPSGDLSPCPFLKASDQGYLFNSDGQFAFNVTRNDLRDVWNSAEFNRFRSLFTLNDNAELFNRNCPHLRSGACHPCVLSGCPCLYHIRCFQAALSDSKTTSQ